MNENSKIINIESDEQQVRIDFRYTNRHGFGGWVRIDPNCFIRPVGSEENLILEKAEGIPISPKSLTFKKQGDVLYYSLFFPPLPVTVEEIDIIEDADDDNSFNFLNVPLKQKTKIMTTNKTTALKNIENIALELKGDKKTQKVFIDEINRLDSKLGEVSDYLKLTKEETAVFCLATYLSITTDSFCMPDLRSHSNFSPFDFYEIKNITKTLVKKGWIVKTGTQNFHRGPKRQEEKVYNIPQNILEALFKNISPEIKKKEMDVYLASDLLHKCLSDYCDDNIEAEEMYSIIHEYEEENSGIQPFKIAAELDLNQMERIILYYTVTKTTIGEETIDIDRMLSNFFNSQMERVVVRRMIAQRDGKLLAANVLEFINDDFKTDKQFKLSENAIKIMFGEDACFVSKKENYSSGLCKLIKCDAIVEKKLFYNDTEQNSINTVSEFLKEEKFTEVVRRLEENKMRPGLTILLHGYPGTGKTETIYQLAKQTNRNILLVNISEIRDKYVGESEKRLKAVFETYKNSFKHFEQVPILLFNESDALIGKRLNVNNSVDQMNNAMQNILLQELEDFRGIMMATTNLTANLDEAFERRFLFKIKYARPSMGAKTSIWKSKLSFLSDEDAKRLAEEFDFSGGQIENISRKIFLDSVLLGKTYSIEDTMQYCEEEELLNKNKTKKIGF
jgi:hypothetical protein